MRVRITYIPNNQTRNSKHWKHEAGGGIWSLAIGGDTPEGGTENYAGLSGLDAYHKFGKSNRNMNEAISNVFLNSPGYDTSYMDFTNYITPSGREMYRENLGKIDRMLADEGFGIAQRSAILGTILHESGGNPSKVDDSGNFFGLVQWSRDRMPESLGIDNSLEGQVRHLISEIRNAPGGAWTSGAPGGEKIMYGNEGRWNFFNTDDPEKAAFYLNKCFIRPWANDSETNHEADRLASYKNRGADARLIYDAIMRGEDRRTAHEQIEALREPAEGLYATARDAVSADIAAQADRAISGSGGIRGPREPDRPAEHARQRGGGADILGRIGRLFGVRGSASGDSL